MDSPLGGVFMDYASKGQLVPDEPTIELWKKSIDGLIATNRFNPEADTLLLDGIPRNPRQAQILGTSSRSKPSSICFARSWNASWPACNGAP